ncbi:MAG TPA: hypothetical protein VEH29_13450, partial [Acidimicrobiales bacterium]|nr:hypothetical protein [Acidimicrobiales bacterium]
MTDQPRPPRRRLVRRTLGRLLTPGAALVLALVFLLAGDGCQAAGVVTHDEGLALAALGVSIFFVFLLWAVLSPDREEVPEPEDATL